MPKKSADDAAAAPTPSPGDGGASVTPPPRWVLAQNRAAELLSDERRPFNDRAREAFEALVGAARPEDVTPGKVITIEVTPHDGDGGALPKVYGHMIGLRDTVQGENFVLLAMDDASGGVYRVLKFKPDSGGEPNDFVLVESRWDPPVVV